MRASNSLLLQPEAVATIIAAAPMVSVFTIAFFMWGCPRWLDFNYEPNGRLCRSGHLFPVRRTAERRDGTRYEIVDKAYVSRESPQEHAR